MTVNRVAHYGGDVAISLGGGFFAGVIVAQVFAPDMSPAYGWIASFGLVLLVAGYLLKFVDEDWRFGGP